MFGNSRKGIVLGSLLCVSAAGSAAASEWSWEHQRDHGSRPVAAAAQDESEQCGGDVQSQATPALAPQGTTTTFCNDSAINIAGDGAASPYPSTINVAGSGGVITDVAVRLKSVLHPNTSRLQLRLQHPNGQVIGLNGSGFDPLEAPFPDALFSQWRFSDRAQIYGLFGTNQSWTAPTDSNHYLAREFAAPQLPPPAPATTARQLLSSLEGLSPNGSWSLWAAQAEDADPDPIGTIADGWCLDVTTADVAPDCYYTVEISGSINAGDVQQAGRISRDGSPSLCGYPRPPVAAENNVALRRDTHNLVNPSPNAVCLTATADFSGCGDNQTMLVLYSSFNPAQPHLNVIGESGFSTINRISFSTRLAGNQPYAVVVHEVEPGTGCPLYRIRLEANTCLPPAAGDRIFYNGFQIMIPIAGDSSLSYLQE